MPGLSQLKQFSSDLLSLGDEINLRAARGEKPVKIEIPKDIEDKNDSEEFVLGMPQIEAEVEVAPAEEDLSDLTALVNPGAASDSKGEAAPAPSFEAPDMSALLNPVVADASDDSGMPDLSMFDEPEEEVQEEIVEEEPEEVSIADMGLDALLAGGGFDEPEPEEEEPEPEQDSSADVDLDDFENVSGLDDIEPMPVSEPEPMAEPEPLEEPLEEVEPLEDLGDFGSAEPLEDFGIPDTAGSNIAGDAMPLESFDEPAGDALPLESFDEPAGDALPLESFDEPSGDAMPLESFDEPSGDAMPLESFDEPSGDAMPLESLDIPAADAEPLEDLGDLGTAEPLEDFGLPEDAGSDITGGDTAGDAMPLESFDEPSGDAMSLDSFDEPSGDAMPLESFDEPSGDAMPLDSFGEPSGDAMPLESFDEPSGDAMPLESLDTPAADAEPLEDIGDFASPEPLEDFGLPEDAGSDATDENADTTPAGLFDASDFDLTGMDEASDFTETPAETPAAAEEIPDFGSGDAGDSASSDFDTDFGTDFSDDFGGGDDSEGDGTGDGIDEGTPEVFDTSAMEGLDFGIPDTDSQLGGGGGEGDFEFGEHSDFAMEGEFEIPGFSDVDTAKEEKSAKPVLATGKDKKGKGKGKGKNLPEPDFTDAQESEDLPPNTLSDEQYKIFLANLAEYPLNVRLAFEDFIVQDEFTDDAEFEIIEKILNKAPARSVAGMLEKMLDTSIPIPRDFEHRTAAEYEAYKKSLSYQLRNKIIPGILFGLILMIVGWGLFKFTSNCIVRPLKANSLYKQGYALLEADEYPQSEMMFNAAAEKRINKKWFFKYARGYRAHKQYQRAGKTYQNILRYFRHNKEAGLEYADMELNDLANYERAEEIVRREVLDYHVNDPDGILKLGDVFLEWGTEKDPEKLELARQQYATLIHLYKPNDLYLSRMMRYFIRTDNLREVIQMQKTFEPREKSLGSEDWAELSGYLLDKYYGPLAPSEEYLRYEIEGLRKLLLRAVKTNPDNPIAQYNLAKYFIHTNETAAIESTLQRAVEKFNTVPFMKKRDLYKYIDSYRLLGEHYIGTNDFLQAQAQFAEGILLYTTERDNAGFEGTPAIGKLYEDMGNIKYSISGDYDDALMNYKYSVELENDSPSIRYRIGYIQYKKNNYTEALGAFMKAGDGNVKERNLMLAMANTLNLRGDVYAAQGYYNQLIDDLDNQVAERELVFPQVSVKDASLVTTYLYASNNYGVTLYKLAKRTGNSALNAKAMVQLSQSVRAWDALTRNQETMVRLEGSNLAEQNIKYITHPIPDFEPAIYTDISKTLLDNEHL